MKLMNIVIFTKDAINIIDFDNGLEEIKKQTYYIAEDDIDDVMKGIAKLS